MITARIRRTGNPGQWKKTISKNGYY